MKFYIESIKAEIAVLEKHGNKKDIRIWKQKHKADANLIVPVITLDVSKLDTEI